MSDDLSLVHFYWSSACPKKPPFHVTNNLGRWSRKLQDTEFIPLLWCDHHTFQGIAENISLMNTADSHTAGMHIDKRWGCTVKTSKDHPLRKDYHLQPSLVLPETWWRNIPKLVQTISCHARMMLWLAEGDDYGIKKTEEAVVADSHENKAKMFRREIFVVNIEDFFESHIKINPLLQFLLYYFRECNRRGLFQYAKDVMTRFLIYILGGFYFDVDIAFSEHAFPQSLASLQAEYERLTGTTKAYLFKLYFFDYKGARIRAGSGAYFSPFTIDLTNPLPLKDRKKEKQLSKEARFLGHPEARLRAKVKKKDACFQEALSKEQQDIQQYRALYDREHPSFKKPYFSQCYPVENRPLKKQLSSEDRQSAEEYEIWFKRYLKTLEHSNQRSPNWQIDKWNESARPFRRPPMPEGSPPSPISVWSGCAGEKDYERYLIRGKIMDHTLGGPIVSLKQLDIFYRKYIEPCTMHQIHIVISSLFCSPYQRLGDYDRASMVFEEFFYRCLKKKTLARIQRILTSGIASTLSADTLEELGRARDYYKELSKSDRTDLYRTLDKIEEHF